MILLDTNVLSEFMRIAPNSAVVAWLDEQSADTVWISAITRAEIELGIALLAEGQRKQGLGLKAETMFEREFAGRCLPFDAAAASRYARIVATRNVADFRQIEALDVINPWSTLAL